MTVVNIDTNGALMKNFFDTPKDLELYILQWVSVEFLAFVKMKNKNLCL